MRRTTKLKVTIKPAFWKGIQFIRNGYEGIFEYKSNTETVTDKHGITGISNRIRNYQSQKSIKKPELNIVFDKEIPEYELSDLKHRLRHFL
jgi:hypothetical protein